MVGAGVLLVSLAIAGPLLTVRRQVYMRNLAIRCEQLTDSLQVSTSEIGPLLLRARALASAQRVERIAREKLNMDYPGPEQIVIVESRPARSRPLREGGIMALLRRSLGQERI
jgi:cell division protein FtsL